jgi:hypothetical protein
MAEKYCFTVAVDADQESPLDEVFDAITIFGVFPVIFYVCMSHLKVCDIQNIEYSMSENSVNIENMEFCTLYP